MNRSRTTRWMIAAALFVFACSPLISPPVISTLDPASLNTAIAGTAAAAAAGTAAQGPQPAFTSSPSGPILDPDGLNTLIAQTAAAAGTQTALLIPPTLTPSMTPFPTWTASITPSPTQTFIFRLPTLTRTPRPRPTSTSSGGGGGGDGRGKPDYSCNLLSVSPEPNTVFKPNQAFQAAWKVRNTGDDWLGNSTDLVFVSGTKFTGQTRFDLPNSVNGSESITLTISNMHAPGSDGTYSANWNLQIGKNFFCKMPITIEVR